MAQTLQMTLMNHKIENISENIGWVLFELGCSNLYKVRHKMIPSMLLRLLQVQRRIYFAVYCGNKICSLSVSLWAAHQVWPSPCTYLFKIQDIWFIAESNECYHGNILMDVTLCLIWCTLLVPRLNIIIPIILEIFSILWSITVICEIINVTSLLKKKLEYFWNDRRNCKIENTNLHHVERN